MPCNWLLVGDVNLCKNPAKGQYCASHAFKIRKEQTAKENAENAKLRDGELNARIVELEQSAKESENRFAKLEQKQSQSDNSIAKSGDSTKVIDQSSVNSTSNIMENSNNTEQIVP
ncbi:15979_t:CDS:2 [Acaulospora colombiana]|uniref:15979_t:CDS:1 n=1 Tax=Acaulospora colombiana TaxID=27376 RepID=A0ACA9K6A8_9GLOM|nr:15979_t:CDS:2 [Acaulospora colombiana]